MIDSNAIANLQMLMNTGDGRQAVLAQLLQSDKFSRFPSRAFLTTIGVNSKKGLSVQDRLFISNSKGANVQRFHRQGLESTLHARTSQAKLPANIIQALDHLPQHEKAPLIQFAEGLAHRVNNIFMAVVGHLSIVMFHLDTTATAYHRLRECEELIHNTALLIRLLVDVFHRSQHAPHTLYPIDLSDHEINKLIFANGTPKLTANTADPSKLHVQKIQMIMAAMMGNRLNRIFHILQNQISRIFHSQDLQAYIGGHHQAIIGHLRRGMTIAHDLMIYANAVEVDQRLVSLTSIIKSSIAIHHAGNSSLKIKVENASTPINLNGNANLLRRMFMEILDNANTAIPHGGEVTIRLCTESVKTIDSLIDPRGASKIKLTFEDNGSGLADCLGVNAFNPFTTIPKSHKQCGMGLAVVSGIVKAHGGTIRFFNRHQGGLVLIIELPL